MNDQQRLELEAAAFRRLVAHLDSRKDVQNIDLMNLSGFCRNCLSKWYKAEADERHIELSLDDAREVVYGMPYAEWKAQYQQEASAEQQAAFAKGNHHPSPEEITELGKQWLKEKYGNLFTMYQKITDENPYETPMKIYPAVHYTMGGVWVDYNLQSTIPGCFVAGEANFSDHGANRLGASALMQGLADGYFVLPYTISNYLADDIRTGKISTDLPEFAEAENRVKETINQFLNNKGSKSVDHFHKRLGLIMWNKVGMGRNEAGLKQAIEEIAALKAEFYKEVNVPGSADELNPQLEKALRVADFIDLGQLMAMDALQRNESCGGHFREEYQDAEGETLRDDENFSFVSAWEYKGDDITKAELHKEELKYEFIKIAARNYK